MPLDKIYYNALLEPYYKCAMDMHMHCKKMYVQQEFSYMKYAGFFVLTFLGFMLMVGKGIISDYLIEIVFTGFGALFATAMDIISISSNIGWKHSCYAKERKWVEEKYSSIVQYVSIKI